MNKYIVDLCKQEEYLDSNGIVWWSNKYRGTPCVLSLYSRLIGQEHQGIKVVAAIKEGVWIKAIVESSEDLTGLYLSTGLKAELTEDKYVESVNYDSIHVLDVPICEVYVVPDAQPFKIYKE